VSHPDRNLSPGEELVQIVQEAGWASGPVWTGGENIAPPGFNPQTFNPVGSHYTNYVTPPTATIFKLSRLPKTDQ